ncbi:Hypothetical_protein [Hexamita inflata]|uniref:Hypothetical_protein n=1 Tax=Hexamita inflata TaxID=28002 RepID=A0AA86PXB2_9EUKA|nr:Hypothetical protein HINF_LOCUS35406 [Hexamita inflata]
MSQSRKLSMLSQFPPQPVKQNNSIIRRKSVMIQSQEVQIPLSTSIFKEDQSLLGSVSFSNLNLQNVQKEISSILEIEQTYQKMFAFKKEIQINNEQIIILISKCEKLYKISCKYAKDLQLLNQSIIKKE